jgi:hypothetical protein
MSHWDFGRATGEHDEAQGAADEGWSADDGWIEDEGTGAYPVTYERWPGPQPPPGPSPRGPEAPSQPWPAAAHPDEERAGDGPGFGRWPADPPAARAPEPDLSDQLRESVRYGDLDEDDADGRGVRRWLVPVGITLAAAAAGAAAVLLTSGHSSPQASAGPTPSAVPSGAAASSAPAAPSAPAPPRPPAGAPLTLTQARGVLARYTQANNAANGQRSTALLATAETGSSYAIDAGFYTQQQGLGAQPFPAFTPVQATYYIPRAEAAGEPRWFAVRVANAFTAKPGQVTSTEYLLFTESAGGVWLNAIEPYVMAGAGAPTVELGTDGFATEVGPAVTSLAAAPGQLPAETAASLDGSATGQGAIAIPGRLSDDGDAQLWRAKLPDATVTDAHAPAAETGGDEFALRTRNGGALVFYTDAAELTITPVPGTKLHLSVPGFYSSAQARTRAGFSYLEQFAAYDPPAGTGAPTVIADFSGITGTS